MLATIHHSHSLLACALVPVGIAIFVALMALAAEMQHRADR